MTATDRVLGRGILFHRLFDDAAIFPPGNAAMPDAVTSHLDWCASPTSHFVGSFVCAGPRWTEFAESLAAAGASGVSAAVTVPSGVAAVQAAVAAAVGESRAILASVEVPLPDEGGLDEAVEVLDAVLPDDVAAFVELPWNAVDRGTCKRLAETRRRLKIRTGGESAESFPSEELLATMITHAVEQEVPFKLTGGLHNAVRHRDPVTGFEHHGFLNVLLATASALGHDDLATVESLLATHDAGRLADRARRLTPEVARGVRRQFVSYGTCSIVEPLQDIKDLGLLGDLRP